ncbi:PLC-like phosphodiesterase [Hesseltinella vesiculosa]|uniref:PLC-like phosphodiesterase n=1 Tax=Hesseltinella vesiculosa TaxID=101127 RepID=A0A1X2GCF2_9FUNG|nr:PLC-like phosphodiesterase [Hesseltinella vesiculosa]
MVKPTVIAHRGFCSKYPENTILSYRKAIEAGAQALEGDIRLSKDNQLVMMHDLTLQRTTTGTGAVGEQDYFGGIDQLTTKDQAQPIARMNDVLDLLLEPTTPDDMWMIIDIKYDNPLAILDAVHDLLKEEKYAVHTEVLQQRVVLGIWHPDFLTKVRELFGDAYKVCFIGASLSGARRHFINKVDYISLAFAALNDDDGRAFIGEAHSHGQKVLSWTINYVEQMHACVLWGVDGIIGNDVKEMLEQVKAETLDSSALKHTRQRLYYFCIKKVMSVASYAYVGI